MRHLLVFLALLFNIGEELQEVNKALKNLGAKF